MKNKTANDNQKLKLQYISLLNKLFDSCINHHIDSFDSLCNAINYKKLLIEM